jgi:multidrug efflux system membrane fusion protein
MYRLRTGVLVAVSGFVLALGACSKTGTGADPPKGPGAAAAPVRVGKAVQEDVPVQIRAIARVEAYSTVTVRARVPGQIMSQHFADGEDVQAGAELFSIDPRPYEAALGQAEGTLARDIALAKDAAEEAAWQNSLLRQQVAAQREYDRAQAAADAAQAAVRAEQAAVEQARLNLEYCSVQSLLDGRAGAALAKVGNVVKADDTPLVVLNQINPIYVTFAVPEQNLARIKKYQATGALAVEAVIPQDEGPAEHGELTFVDNQVDRTTGMILLKGTFSNAKRRLWPGQFVNVTLSLTTEAGAIVVPSQAVQTGQSGQYVFVVKEDQTVEMRPVTVGLVLDNRTVIQSGVAAGETVVTDGQLRLVPGAKVSIKEGPTSAPTSSAARQAMLSRPTRPWHPVSAPQETHS